MLDRLREAITGYGQYADGAEAALTRAFGDRIPGDHTLIKAEELALPATPAVLTSGLVKSMGNEREPREAVKREGDRRYG